MKLYESNEQMSAWDFIENKKIDVIEEESTLDREVSYICPKCQKRYKEKANQWTFKQCDKCREDKTELFEFLSGTWKRKYYLQEILHFCLIFVFGFLSSAVTVKFETFDVQFIYTAICHMVFLFGTYMLLQKYLQSRLLKNPLYQRYCITTFSLLKQEDIFILNEQVNLSLAGFIKPYVSNNYSNEEIVYEIIVVNAVHPVTGKKLRITRKDYTDMKDEANRLGKEMGFSEIDFRKKAKNNRTAEEQHIILKGGTSWKEELREVIEEAKQTALSEEEFITHLSLYGVTLNRTKTEYSYLHPKKKKPIRGAKLGENYTKKEILNGINKNRYGGTSNSVIGIRETYEYVQGYDGQPTASRSIGEIERELQRLNQESEFARQGLDGRSEIAKREQRVRDEKNDSISNGDGGRVSGSSEGGTSVQDGNKSNYKKRDYSFSK